MSESAIFEKLFYMIGASTKTVTICVPDADNPGSYTENKDWSKDQIQVIDADLYLGCAENSGVQPGDVERSQL